MILGVNGVGKTTTIAKMAKLFSGEGYKVLLAAGDTFRAAAVEQLEVWGKRNNIRVYKGPNGCDAAGLCFDGLTEAIKQLTERKNLSKEMMTAIMEEITEGNATEAQNLIPRGKGKNGKRAAF